MLNTQFLFDWSMFVLTLANSQQTCKHFDYPSSEFASVYGIQTLANSQKIDYPSVVLVNWLVFMRYKPETY